MLKRRSEAPLSQKRLLPLEEYKAQARGFETVAGVDEAGRGPLAGPVVAASVTLRDYRFTARIDDSKKLSAHARERAYHQILQRADVGIGVVSEDVVDEINIYQATMLAMERAVLALFRYPDMLLIDGDIKLRLELPQNSIIKGDEKVISIACASIVAKVARDRLLRFYGQIFPGYGFCKHKGYATKGHIRALKERGFSPIHRQTFKVTGLKEMGV